MQLKINQGSTTHESFPFKVMFSKKLNHQSLISIDQTEEKLPATKEFAEKDVVSRLNFAKSVLFLAGSGSLAKSASQRASTFKQSHALIPNFAIGSLVMVKNMCPKSKFDFRAFGP